MNIKYRNYSLTNHNAIRNRMWPFVTDQRVKPQPKPYKTMLSSNLYLMRNHRRLSQSELAEKAGISRKTISAIECSKTLPTLLVAMKIAAAMDYTVEDLFRLK